MTTLPGKLPFQLILELTPKCNYKCPFCYCLWHEYPELAKNILTFSQWTEIIDEAVAKGCKNFLFSGGEPLLRPDLRELIEYAGKIPDVKLEMFTNASRMTEDDLQYFKSRQVKLGTSLQGLRTYGEMTGTKRKFYKTIDFISRCRELDFPCSVGITVTALNLFEIEDIVSAAVFAGASAIQLSVFMEAGRGKEHAELKVSEKEWLALKDKINRQNYRIPIGFGDEFICKCMTDESFVCAAGTSFGVVSPNGVYRKCLHYYRRIQA